jgi:hypothetical protein
MLITTFTVSMTGNIEAAQDGFRIKITDIPDTDPLMHFHDLEKGVLIPGLRTLADTRWKDRRHRWGAS